jgi:hypothetical protein
MDGWCDRSVCACACACVCACVCVCVCVWPRPPPLPLTRSFSDRHQYWLSRFVHSCCFLTRMIAVQRISVNERYGGAGGGGGGGGGGGSGGGDCNWQQYHFDYLLCTLPECNGFSKCVVVRVCSRIYPLKLVAAGPGGRTQRRRGEPSSPLPFGSDLGPHARTRTRTRAPHTHTSSLTH